MLGFHKSPPSRKRCRTHNGMYRLHGAAHINIMVYDSGHLATSPRSREVAKRGGEVAKVAKSAKLRGCEVPRNFASPPRNFASRPRNFASRPQDFASLVHWSIVLEFLSHLSLHHVQTRLPARFLTIPEACCCLRRHIRHDTMVNTQCHVEQILRTAARRLLAGRRGR